MIPTPDEFDRAVSERLLDIARHAYRELHAAYVEALDREAAFTAAMEELAEEEISDVLDKPRPCLKVSGVVQRDGTIEAREAL